MGDNSCETKLKLKVIEFNHHIKKFGRGASSIINSSLDHSIVGTKDEQYVLKAIYFSFTFDGVNTILEFSEIRGLI